MLPQRLQCRIDEAGQVKIDDQVYQLCQPDASPFDVRQWLNQEVLVQGVVNGDTITVETLTLRPTQPAAVPPANNRSGTTLYPKTQKKAVDWRGLWSMIYDIEPPTTDNPPWNAPEDRSQQAIWRIVKFLDVENTPRYQPRNDSTCCTIFVADVTRMMHCGIPTDPTGSVRWSNRAANIMIRWLDKVGLKTEGWRELASAEEAQARANLGYPTVGLYTDPNGPGHVVMVVPGQVKTIQVDIGTKRNPKLVDIVATHTAQAGAKNFSSGYWAKPGIRYITHD